MHTLFEPAVPPLLPVIGSNSQMPVRHVWCVGRNYAEHAKEMGGDVRESPFFFGKFADRVVACAYGTTCLIPYPPATINFQHEVELVVAIGEGGQYIHADRALAHVIGYAVGLDMTRRDLQFALRDKGRPWDMAKNFSASAPCGPLHPVGAVGHPGQGRITLDVNGTRRQSGDISELIWSVPEIIQHLSALAPLFPGDLIYTGTPVGVGPVVVGDVMHAAIEGLGAIDVKVA